MPHPAVTSCGNRSGRSDSGRNHQIDASPYLVGGRSGYIEWPTASDQRPHPGHPTQFPIKSCVSNSAPIEGGRAGAARRVATGRHGRFGPDGPSTVLPEEEEPTWLGWSGNGDRARGSATVDDSPPKGVPRSFPGDSTPMSAASQTGRSKGCHGSGVTAGSRSRRRWQRP